MSYVFESFWLVKNLDHRLRQEPFSKIILVALLITLCNSLTGF